jgi:asparagine synthase (glutamine-hydrolysing)
VRRLSGDAYRPGVFLSGGLDSRTILGLVERRPVVSLTYGQRESRDVCYARRIARAVGSEHHWVDLPDGRWVLAHVDAHLRMTEGFHSWIHAHGMSTLAAARELMDVNLTGWDGGTVMGHQESFDPLQIEAVDDTALALRLFHRFNQEFTWASLTEAEEALVYREPLRGNLLGLAFASFREELARFLAYRRDVRNEYFYIRNHCRRLTQNFVVFTQSHVEVRFPFFDYAVFDALYSVPTAVRGHQRLYRSVIRRETPRLSHIPYDHDDRLPTDRTLLRELHALPRRVAGQLNHRFGPLFCERPMLYADYEGYLRRELRPWAEQILFDQRTADRGIFDPAFLRTLLDRHLSGREQNTIGKIAPIITYEMMLRRFLD